MKFLEIPVIHYLLLGMDLFIVWFVLLQIYKSMVGSRSWQIVRGIFFILVLALVSRFLQLGILNWILQNLLQFGLLALIVVFQPEFRKLLTKVGESRMPGYLSDREKEYVLEELTEAVKLFSKRKTGALIVFRMKDFLSTALETGVKLEAVFSAKLLTAIFNKKSLLHDGATIVYYDQIVAAACILPLTDDPSLDAAVGTRHRAAIGITEETDAVVVVVSEETGRISIVAGGKATLVKPDAFKSKMEQYYEKSIKREQKTKRTLRDYAPHFYALATALLLWFVVQDINTIEKKYDLPLAVMNKAGNVRIISGIDQSILVGVKGSKDLFQSFNEKSLRPYIDLSHVVPGTNQVDVMIDKKRFPFGLKVTSSLPDRLTIVVSPAGFSNR